MLTALLATALLQAPATPALPAPAPARVIAFDRPETATTGPALTVSSTSVAEGGYFPLTNSGYGRNYSPSVQWTEGPAATKSFVLIVEDPDAGEARPLLHWLAYDMAANTYVVKDKTKNLAQVKEPVVLEQGANDHGGVGWTGPHPPGGAPPHHYHLQVFALDRKDIAKPGADLAKVLAAMKGHVVAKGEMLALYQQLPDKVRKPPKPPKGSTPAPETAALPAPETPKP